jgi:hypothetical protein
MSIFRSAHGELVVALIDVGEEVFVSRPYTRQE